MSKSRITGEDLSFCHSTLRNTIVEDTVIANSTPLSVLNLLTAARPTLRQSALISRLQIDELFNVANPCRIMTEWLINPSKLHEHADLLIPKLVALLLHRNENAVFAAGCLMLVCGDRLQSTSLSVEMKNQLNHYLSCAQTTLETARIAISSESLQAAYLAVSIRLLLHRTNSKTENLNKAKLLRQHLLKYIPLHHSSAQLTVSQQCYVRIAEHFDNSNLKLNDIDCPPPAFRKLNTLPNVKEQDRFRALLDSLTIKVFEKKLTALQEHFYCEQLLEQLTDPTILHYFATHLNNQNIASLLKSACRLLGFLCYRSQNAKTRVEIVFDSLPLILENLRGDDISEAKVLNLLLFIMREALIDLESYLQLTKTYTLPLNTGETVAAWMNGFLREHISTDENVVFGNNILAVGLNHLPHYDYAAMCALVANLIQSISDDREVIAASKQNKSLRSLLVTLEVVDDSMTILNILTCLLWNICLNHPSPVEQLKMANDLTKPDPSGTMNVTQQIVKTLAMTIYCLPSATNLKPQTERVRHQASELLAYIVKHVPEAVIFLTAELQTYHTSVISKNNYTTTLFNSPPRQTSAPSNPPASNFNDRSSNLCG